MKRRKNNKHRARVLGHDSLITLTGGHEGAAGTSTTTMPDGTIIEVDIVCTPTKESN